MSGSVLSLLVPILPFPDISQWLSNSSLVGSLSMVLPEIVTTASDPGLNPHLYIFGFYTLVCLVLGSLMLFKVRRIFSLINKCERSTDFYRGHTLYMTHGCFPSSSYFNFLLWDNTTQTDELHKRLILDHEIIHIEQGHSYDLMFLELIKIVFWFNPMVWYLLKELRNVHEFIADKQIVDTSNQQHYTKFLAQQTLDLSNIPWVHHFNRNLTLKRINMISTSQNPTRFWKYGVLAGIYIFLQIMVSCTDEQLTTQASVDEIFTKVDEMPSPQNGMQSLYQAIGSKLKYPVQARRMGIEGKVFVEFVVQKSGKLTDIRVLKGIGAGCDEAAKTVLSEIDNWNPGVLNGNAVAVKMVLPIVFKLSPSEDQT